MSRLRPALAGLLILVGASSGAAQVPNKAAAHIEYLPRDHEVGLALSAAPAHVAQAATVYVLEREGYAVARQGSNGFACLLMRDRFGGVYPICYDAAGAATFLERDLSEAKLLLGGKGKDEVERELAAGFQTGRFRLPERVSVAYMLSSEGRANIKSADGSEAVGPLPPHIMIFAPYLTNADIGGRPPVAGASASSHPLVFVGPENEGRPDSFIVVMMPPEVEAR